MRDDLFKSHNDIANFRFDESVVEVFDDMVKRSVPGYDSMIQMVGLVARMYGKDNTNYYDLGSSTGAITLAISLNNNHKNNKFIAIDNSPDMVKKCQQNLSKKIDNLEVICSDINEIINKTVEEYLNDIDYGFDGYVPKIESLNFINFIKLVNDGSEENKSPVVHMKVMDDVFTDTKRTCVMCHRGFAKTTLIGEYLFEDSLLS
jgi:SAM-dependent methyltransferase